MRSGVGARVEVDFGILGFFFFSECCFFSDLCFFCAFVGRNDGDFVALSATTVVGSLDLRFMAFGIGVGKALSCEGDCVGEAVSNAVGLCVVVGSAALVGN